MSNEVMKSILPVFMAGMVLIVLSMVTGSDQKSIKSRISALEQQHEETALQLTPIGGVVGLCLPQDEVVKLISKGNWLLCDGSEIVLDEFPELYNRLSKVPALTSGNTVQVPDLRGRFLRGVDGDQAKINRDPDRNSTKETVCSAQSDAFASHSHDYTYNFTGGSGGAIQWGGDADREKKEGTTQSTGESETRPKNVAVYWFIRAR